MQESSFTNCTSQHTNTCTWVKYASCIMKLPSYICHIASNNRWREKLSCVMSSYIGTMSYIPFSEHTADALRDRFFNVTQATLLGTMLIAVIQGTLIGTGFWIVGLPSACVRPLSS